MDFRKFALVPAVSLALLGCGDPDTGGDTLTFEDRNPVCASGTTPPCMTTADGATEESRTVTAPDQDDPITATYVISTLSIPVAAGTSAAGFNLDNLNSGEGLSDPTADCQSRIADFTGLSDPGLVGVDNALQTLVPVVEGFLDEEDCGGDTDGCLDRTVQAQITAGTVLIIAEVADVNSFTYDTSVTMQLYLGAVPAGGSVTLDGSGALAAGQTFDTVMAVGPVVTGDIFNGRLRVHAPTITIPIDAGGFMLPLMISNAEVRFNITAAGLSNGVIGGSLRNADIVAAAMEFAPDMISLVQGFLMTIADITPSAADQRSCEALSVGVTFGATTAVRNAT